MISLHVYINPKSGRQAELEANIRDRWLAAMSTQPGFISAAVLTPFADDALEALGASKPKTAYQVVSFWESEGLRLEWVARPIHDEVFMPLMDLAADVSYTLNDVAHQWNLGQADRR
ncbi:MAG: antibiotic biosynthesis monooxygenase [Candidatus Latescibacterota bacterium]|jgi:heme-degrading monooxygenase HmoA